MNLTSILAVGGGAAAGGILRFMISGWIPGLPGRFPLATFLINLSGSFLLGFLVGLTMKESGLSATTRLMLTTGFCGGFTTFSTFSMEAIQLIQHGTPVLAGMYMIGSVLGGLLCAWLGFKLMA